MTYKHKSVVIIGGGIVGCSIAYHLVKRGVKDVLVLEKGELTSGSTWHAAGLVGQLRSSRNITNMLKYSVELYARLEAETGQATGWRQVGGLRLASSPERMIELKRAKTMAKSFGLDMQLLTTPEVCRLFPIICPDEVVGGAFLPTDGYADPAMLTHALAKGAKAGGAKFSRKTRVLAIHVDGGRAKQIVTDQGNFQADVIVNAAGMWAREIGIMAGVNVPLIPVQHQYIVTEVIPDLPKGMPTMRDPDNLVYYKEEAGALVMGGYEPNPIPWSVAGIPKDFGQELLESNFDHFETISRLAIKRTPLLQKVGIRTLINGPEAFTPDGHFIMGKAPELENFYVAAGFNAHGIAAGGGAGRMMAEWIIDGRPTLDLWEVDILRFSRPHQDLTYVTDRTLELYAKHYALSWPHEEYGSARPYFTSPLYPTLKARGAVFGAKSGWERPNWFAPPGIAPIDEPSFGRPNWFEHVAREHLAIRERVALIDQSSFSKFRVSGRDALAFLQYLAANNVDRPVGSLIYTQLCNAQGGIEADITIMRVAAQDFYIVTGTAFGTHDGTWLRSQLNPKLDVAIEDITLERSVINVCGPLAGSLLAKVAGGDFTNRSFAFGTCRSLSIAGKAQLAARLTYVGESGFELHGDNASALAVYESLVAGGQEFGLIDAGYRAIESCRLEKGYRYWSADITPDTNPYEAGLGFCVDLNKGQFLGRQALEQIRAQGPDRQLCCFSLAEPSPFYGKEPIIHEDQVVGVITSAGYGYTVEKSIAFGYVPKEHVADHGYEIEVLGKRIGASRHKQALYDPGRERILKV